MNDAEQKNNILSPTQSIFVGATVGAAQTAGSLWLWTMKVRTQCRYPFTLNPRVLYKGFGPALTSIGIMSVLQVLLTTTTHRLFHQPKEMAPQNSDQIKKDTESFPERCVSALLGGAAATLVSNPVGVTITQQHKKDEPQKKPATTLSQTSKNSFTRVAIGLLKQQGFGRFYVSFGPNCVINSVFTFSFYAFYPWLQEKFTQYHPNPMLAESCAGISIGLLAGLTLQPIDMIKTMQEAHADEKKLSVGECIRNIYKQGGGARRFYAGFWAGSASTAVASTIAALGVKTAESYFSRNNHL